MDGPGGIVTSGFGWPATQPITFFKYFYRENYLNIFYF